MEETHSDLYKREQSYWWSAIQRNVALSVWNKFSKPKVKHKILDVGCGAGALVYDLQEQQHLRAYGMDFSIQACSHSKNRKIDVFQADVCHLPLKDNCVDVIFALNLIEHIEDELAALRQICRACIPGGVLILIVPAWNCLWGRRDDWLGHKRRYTAVKLKASLEEAGFKIIRRSYIHALLFPTLYLWNKVSQFFRLDKIKSDIFAVPGPLNTFLIYLFSLETKLFSWLNLPIGTSIACVAKKCQ